MARRSVRVVLPVFVAVVLGWASATVRGQAIHRPYSLDPCPGGQGLSTSDNPCAGKCSAFDQTGDLPDGGGPDVAGPDAGGGSDAMRLRLMSIFDERRLSRLGKLPTGGRGLRVLQGGSWPMVVIPVALPGGGHLITDPEVLEDGEFAFAYRDLYCPHDGTFLAVDRVYRHKTDNPMGSGKDFGRNFHTNLRLFVDVTSNRLNATAHLGTGEPIQFTRSGTEITAFNAPAGYEQYDLVEDNASGTKYYLTNLQNEYQYEFDGGATGTGACNALSTYTRLGKGEVYYYNSSGDPTRVHLIPAEKDIYVDRDNGLIIRIRDYAGRTVAYEYDSNGLILTEDPCGSCGVVPATGYAWEAAEGSTRINQLKDAYDQQVLTVTYDENNRLTQLVDASNGTHRYSYDTASGTWLTVAAPEGSTTRYGFDGQRNLVTRILGYASADPITYSYEYNDSYLMTKKRLPNGSDYAYEYNCVNALNKVVFNDGASHSVTPYWIVAENSTHRDVLDALDGTTAYEYGDGGVVTRLTRPDGSAWDYSYQDGLLSQTTDGSGRTRQYRYDGTGLLTAQVADPDTLNLQASYTIDELGRRLTTTSPEGRMDRRAYNAAGEVTLRISAEGISTRYEYDLNGRQTANKLVDGETTLYTWTRQYDLAGLPIRMIAPGPLSTAYAYDTKGRLTLQTNPGDRIQRRTYDLHDRVVTSAFGVAGDTIDAEILTYDVMDHVVTSQDAMGYQTLYTYDGFGRQTTAQDPNGAYAVYGYDNAFRQTNVARYSSTNDIQTESVITYDAVHRPIATIDKYAPGGDEGDSDRETESVYDGADRLTLKKVWIDSGQHDDTSYTYDGAGRMVTVTEPGGFASTYALDRDGWRTTAIDANGHQATYAYDQDGRQTQVTNANGDYSVTDLDKRGLQTGARQYASGGSLKASTAYTYDDAGRRITVRRKYDPSGSKHALDEVTLYAYNAAGDVSKVTAASGNDTAYAYDQYGRRTLVRLPEGSYTTDEYNRNGAVTKEIRYELIGGNTHRFRQDYIMDALGRAVTTINQGPDATFGNGDDLSTRYVYDAVGRQVTLIDEGGKVDVYTYDALSQNTKVTEDSAAIARVTEFGYDRAGRMTTLSAYTDSPSTGQENTGYQYNGRGQQTIVTYEETGDITMAYDAAGNMTLRTDEAGIVVAYAYDATNRLTDRRKSGASSDIEKYAYDALGRLVTAKKGTSGNDDAVSQSIFGYDALSRVTQESQAIAEGTAQAVNYTYDKAGNRVTLRHDSGAITAQYAYDSRDRCTGIDHYNGSAWVELADYTWLGNAISRRDTTCDYPGKTKPKFSSDYQRDGLMRVTKLEHKYLTANQSDSGYDTLGTFEYGYDTSSDAVSALQTASLGKLDADRWYKYDSLNRLVTGRVADTQNWTGASTKTSWYTYDDLGNRISHQYRDATPIGYAHDKANRMTTLADKTQGYDLAGNLTLAYSADRGTSYLYNYDHNNRLIDVCDGGSNPGSIVRRALFKYDALGRRIEFINSKLATTVRYYYDGVNEIVETDSQASPVNQRTYIHGISYVDERLMMKVCGTSRPYYYVLDRMYNVWLLLDRAGAIVERYCYDEYGRPLIRESAGRGDMDNNTVLDSTDLGRLRQATGMAVPTIWDPRADLDDDGDCDTADYTLYLAKDDNWPPAGSPTVAQAFSDVGNPFGFQGRVHFALDTLASATDGKLMLVDHRARMNDPVTGRWITRDPLFYGPPHNSFSRWGRWIGKSPFAGARDMNLYGAMGNDPVDRVDPNGRCVGLSCDEPSTAEPTESEEDDEGIISRAKSTAASMGGKACAVAIELATALPIANEPGGWSYGPAFSHCLSHCLIARYCPKGQASSRWQGDTTEKFEACLCEWYKKQKKAPPAGLCESAYQLSDWWDNDVGREQAERPGSCYQNCKEALGATFLPEGPNTDRPFGPLVPGGTSPFTLFGSIKPRPPWWPRPTPDYFEWLRRWLQGPPWGPPTKPHGELLI